MRWRVIRSVSTSIPEIEIATGCCDALVKVKNRAWYATSESKATAVLRPPHEFGLRVEFADPRRFGIEGLVQVNPEHPGEE
jgi:hypothetical protein